jgi:hypothetical protein
MSALDEFFATQKHRQLNGDDPILVPTWIGHRAKAYSATVLDREFDAEPNARLMLQFKTARLHLLLQKVWAPREDDVKAHAQFEGSFGKAQRDVAAGEVRELDISEKEASDIVLPLPAAPTRGSRRSSRLSNQQERSRSRRRRRGAQQPQPQQQQPLPPVNCLYVTSLVHANTSGKRYYFNEILMAAKGIIKTSCCCIYFSAKGSSEFMSAYKDKDDGSELDYVICSHLLDTLLALVVILTASPQSAPKWARRDKWIAHYPPHLFDVFLERFDWHTLPLLICSPYLGAPGDVVWLERQHQRQLQEQRNRRNVSEALINEPIHLEGGWFPELTYEADTRGRRGRHSSKKKKQTALEKAKKKKYKERKADLDAQDQHNADLERQRREEQEAQEEAAVIALAEAFERIAAEARRKAQNLRRKNEQRKRKRRTRPWPSTSDSTCASSSSSSASSSSRSPSNARGRRRRPPGTRRSARVEAQRRREQRSVSKDDTQHRRRRKRRQREKKKRQRPLVQADSVSIESRSYAVLLRPPTRPAPAPPISRVSHRRRSARLINNRDK